MTQQRVLAVEDDRGMRDFYKRFFSGLYPPEFSASVVKNAEEALDVIHANPLDLMIVDWALPGISGLDLIRALRSHPKTQSLGILMVTARAGADDAVDALESGADDYISKPFEDRVLLARLHSLARRREEIRSQHEVYELPGLKLDVLANKLVADGRTVRLAPKEVELLRLLLARPDITHSSGFLWDAVWGYDTDRWEHILTVTISRLRTKLGPKWGPRIVSHRKKGYGFSK